MDTIQWNCTTLDNTQTCNITNTEPLFTPNFSSGDIMISILLLILLLLQMVKFLRYSIKATKVIREYQGNNSPDGKEFYNI